MGGEIRNATPGTNAVSTHLSGEWSLSRSILSSDLVLVNLDTRGYYNGTLQKGTPKLFALAGELRHNGHVPRYARPLDADNVEDPIKALGSMVRAGIIGYIRNHGASTRGEIAAGTSLAVPTVAKALQALVASGMLLADPPLDQALRGQRIKYTVNDAAVSEMYFQLGIAIGEL